MGNSVSTWEVDLLEKEQGAAIGWAHQGGEEQVFLGKVED